MNVVYVDPRGTSTLCPVCRVKPTRSPSGYRLMKCLNCGVEEDWNFVAVRNLPLNYPRDVPSSSVQGESPPMTPLAKRENLAEVTGVNTRLERLVLGHHAKLRKYEIQSRLGELQRNSKAY